MLSEDNIKDLLMQEIPFGYNCFLFLCDALSLCRGYEWLAKEFNPYNPVEKGSELKIQNLIEKNMFPVEQMPGFYLASERKDGDVVLLNKPNFLHCGLLIYNGKSILHYRQTTGPVIQSYSLFLSISGFKELQRYRLKNDNP